MCYKRVIALSSGNFTYTGAPMLEIAIVFFGGLTIGTVLGLLGAGGAILAIPLMVHTLNYSLEQAMGASLVIVFSTALAANWRGWKNRDLDLRLALVYAVIGATFSAVTAKIAPGWDQEYRRIAFIALLALSGSAVFWPKPSNPKGTSLADTPLLKLILVNSLPAALVGVVAGGLGVGGGFMLVPLMHIASGLAMSRAVGTAMVVILANSGFGFLGALEFLSQSDLRWWPVVGFTVLSILISQPMVRYRGQIDQRTLKIAFSVVLWIIASVEGVIYALE